MPENLATVYGPEETKLRVALIDQSHDAAQAARQEAVRRRTEHLNEGGKFSHFVKGIWDNVAGDYYQLRDTRAAQKRIDETGDVNIFEMTPEQSRQSRAATINRYTSVYEETIHTEAGEIREVQAPDTELAMEIKELIRKSVEGGLSDASMAEERTRILNAYYETHGGEAIGEGKVTVDNLLAIRDATQGAIDNGESLNRVLANMTVSMGEARSGVRTEANYTMVDKVIDKVNKTTVGSLIGPEVVATAATVAASLLRYGSRRVLSAAAMTVAPGATAGLWAGLRENKRVKDERVQHSRDMAEGKEFEPGSKRREGMETTRYETVSSIDLTDNLQSLFGEATDLDDNETFRSALDTLAATQARIRMSDQRNIDLISYPKGNVEEQRLALDIALAQAKTIAEHHLTPEMILALDLPPNLELNDLLNQQAAAFIESLDEDISEKDAAFKRLKTRRVATAAATGVTMGLLGGALVQEGVAAVSDSRQGLVEQLWNAHNKPFEGMQHQTLLNGLVHGEGGQDVVSHHAAEATSNNFILGAAHNADYSLSADHNLVDNGNGTLNLVDPTGHVTVENLPINPDGSMPQTSLDVLHSNGMSVVDTSHNIDVVSTQTHDVSVDQYVANHQDQITHVARDGWYDNNTPTVYDRNELGLHWGGDAGSNGNGGYSMSVATMTHNGSFSGDHAANWAEQAQSGNLQLAVSASGNTQAEVFMVNIGPDGKIDIPAGSPAAQFFSSENGHTTFNGAYAEVVQKTGIDANGVEHMRPLATLVGHDNVGLISDTVETHVAQLKPEYQITTAGYDTTEHFNSFTEMAPVIPIISRRPLERLARREHNYYGYGYEGDGGMSEAEVIKETNERSPRLKSNPEAVLQPQQELSWFKDELLERRGTENLALIEQKIDNSPELSSMSGEVETIVTIPVAAAQEADTIYGALSLYGRQNVESLRKSLVLLNLNWLDKTMTDPAKKAAVDKSRQEIERARQDFPALKIAVVENEYSSERVEATGGVIGYVAADLADTALLAIQKRMEAGAMDPDHEVLLIRNDADPEGMSIRYLDKYQQAIHNPKNKDMDVFKGVTRFGVKWAEKYPGFAVASNFAAGLSIALSSRGLPATGGANFAIKASTLAAIGGLGVMTRTGAGSDDGALGRRIRHARNGIGITRKEDNTQTSILPNGEKVNYRAVAAHVGGATVDTNPSRLVPYYIQGASYSDAWGSDFSSGDGGYRERAAGMTVTPSGKSEIAADWDMQFSGIEATITSEMHWNGTRDINHALFIFFSQVPGAYTITGAGSNREDETYYHRAQFKLTKAGKKYLKKRFERDGYGKSLSTNLYRGNAGQGRVPTLVSPL